MSIQKGEYTHIGNRPVNEDTFRCAILSDSSVYAVLADGLGAHGGGSTASQIAVKCLSQWNRPETLPSVEQISEWIQSANREVLSCQTDSCQMRTTLVYLAVAGNQAVWAHVGDSRLYHFCNGALQDYTLDHSIPQIQVKTGEITRDEIRFSPDRNKLLRAVGTQDLRWDIHGPVTLQPGWHAFLLCSDGFWEYVSDGEIWLDLQKSATPQEWIDYLRCRGEMRKMGSIDNNTAVAIYLHVSESREAPISSARADRKRYAVQPQTIKDGGLPDAGAAPDGQERKLTEGNIVAGSCEYRAAVSAEN